jgi:hypothetical protein
LKKNIRQARNCSAEQDAGCRDTPHLYGNLTGPSYCFVPDP